MSLFPQATLYPESSSGRLLGVPPVALRVLREIVENADGKYLSKDVKVSFTEVEVDAPDTGYALGVR